MKTFNSLSEINDLKPCAVALGNFDGVHKGHQELISEAVEKAKELGIKSAVFTFSNHPRSLIPGGKKVKNIIYSDEKAALIENLGVDYLFNIEFTQQILTMEPSSFVEELLVGKFKAREVFCGFNYKFGYKAEGNVQLLKECGKRLGFNVNVIEIGRAHV